MTVSMPLPTPTPAQSSSGTGKAAAAATKTSPAKAAAEPHRSPEGTGVADMFAALVAAVATQLGPVTPTETTPVVTPPSGDAAVSVVPVDQTAIDVSGLPVADIADDVALLPQQPVDAPAVDAPVDGTADAATAPMEQAARPGRQPAAPARAEGGPTPAVPGERDAEALSTQPVAPTGDGEEVPGAGRATPASAAAAAPAPAIPATPAPAPVADDARTSPVAATPVAPAAPAVDTPSQVSAPAPAAPADPHVQVARVVRPLRLGSDGTYELALDLTPADLGRVRIDVELRGATVSLNLRADNPATRQLLEASLDQLRSELESAGLSAGDLDVGGQRAHEQSPDDIPAGGLTPADAADDATALTSPAATHEDDHSPSDEGVDVLA